MFEHENKRDIHARSSSAARLTTPRRVAPRHVNGAALRLLAVRFMSVSSFHLPSLPSRLLLLRL